MAFPPLFSKFGSSLSDLLSKRYNYNNHQIVSKNALASDLTLETTLSTPGDKFGVFSGKVKANYKNRDYGDVETEMDTEGPLRAELKTTKVADGLTLTATANQEPSAKLVADYRTDSFVVSGGVSTKQDATVVEGSGVFGYEGAAFGLSAKYNVSSSEWVESDAAVQYTRSDFTLMAQTQERAERVVFSMHHQLPSRKAGLKTSWGAKVAATIANPLDNKVLTMGCEHDLNSQTTVRAKLDTRGTATALLENRFDNPNVKVGVTAQWELTKKSTTADKVGVSLTFGEN